MTRQVWDTPFITAETEAVPGAAAVSCPSPLTDTEEGLEELQVTGKVVPLTDKTAEAPSESVREELLSRGDWTVIELR